MTTRETKIDHNGIEFIGVCPFWDNQRIKMAPDRTWNPKGKCWHMPALPANASYILDTFKDDEITPVARQKAKTIKKNFKPKDDRFPAWYKFKSEPMPHQVECLNKAWAAGDIAMFMWMGRGKTFTAINYVTARVMSGEINAMVVLCISGVKPVWPVEFDKHCPIERDMFILEAGQRGMAEFTLKPSAFKVLIVGIEALSQGNAFKFVENFIITHRCATFIDESSSIKNPKSIRTKKAWHLGGLSKIRGIMTGTEVTEGIENLFAQYRFLNWQIIGQKSYYNFTARYCVFGGFENRQIVGYNNIKELLDRVKPYTYSIGKDVAGLPPQIYKEPIRVKSTKEQRRVFADLKEQEYTAIDDKELKTETVLERTMRYQQICGGFFPFDEEEGHGIIPIPGNNPKLQALLDLLSDVSSHQQVIIWARFIPEIELIYTELSKIYTEDVVDKYIGGSTTEERIQKVKDFQDGKTRFLIGNKTMAFGVTLTAATLNIYYSNDFSYEIRKQSEERSHRKGTTHSVTYIDIIIDHPVESRILTALKKKKSVAEFVKEEMGAYDDINSA